MSKEDKKVLCNAKQLDGSRCTKEAIIDGYCVIHFKKYSKLTLRKNGYKSKVSQV